MPERSLPMSGRNMSDRNQFHALVHHFPQRFDRCLSILVIGDDFDPRAGLARDLKISDIVAGVFGYGCEYAIAGFEGDGIERHISGARRILDDRYFITMSVQ